MKTLVILAHPHLESSKINRAWAEKLATLEEVEVHNLYALYPDNKIDVQKEQTLLLAYDRIMFQFPMYWYSTPALLKEWQDQVLEYGFAYGSTGDKLHGKELLLAISTGGPAESYKASGYNFYQIPDLLKPLHAMANLCGLTVYQPFLLQGAYTQTPESIAQSAEALVHYVQSQNLELLPE